jgi:hypothetical protein
MHVIPRVAITDALHCRDGDVSNRRAMHRMFAERHRDRGVPLDGQPEDHE